jgi:hypothetical protein
MDKFESQQCGAVESQHCSAVESQQFESQRCSAVESRYGVMDCESQLHIQAVMKTADEKTKTT